MKTKSRSKIKSNTRRGRTEYKVVMCSKCGRMPVTIETTSESGICWLCVTMAMDPPSQGYKPSGKPRGWQFMTEYVDASGVVYHKGVEQPDLKGTRPETKVVKKPVKKKINKKVRERAQSEAAAQMYDLKKELEKETRKTYKAKIEAKIKKLQKILK